jgi:succinoglycan biosynthesis protein ExoA
MSHTLPRVTLIIAARPDQAEIKAAEAALRLDYPRECLEILIARGTQPAVQRNVAIREATGELVYFLDDDSVAPPGNLRKSIVHFAQPEVQMVGGPNVCPPDAPPLEQFFALVMGSWLAFGPSRARYLAVGALRATNEKELILCNLMARRSTLLDLGGFDESLYPNEENALMDAIQAKGGKMLYDPEFKVYRRPRRTLKSFVKMLLNYGRGRAEQFRLHPTAGSALNFAPPLFCLYLLLGLLMRGPWLWPLAAYGLALLAQAATLSARNPGSLLAAIPLIALSHVMYGLGFWRGLFTKLHGPQSRPTIAVQLERVSVP